MSGLLLYSTRHLPAADEVVNNPAALAAALAASKKSRKRSSQAAVGEEPEISGSSPSSSSFEVDAGGAEDTSAESAQQQIVALERALVLPQGTAREMKYLLEGDKKGKVAVNSPVPSKVLRRFRHLNQPQ